MFKNYFKIAWRNISKNKFHAFINIMGLSTGIAFTLLIAAYVWSELQVNRDLKNVNRQYIIQTKWATPGEGFEIATLGPLAKTLKEVYPGLVKNYYRYDGITSSVYKGDKSFRENIQLGDSTYLNMYGFSLLYGNAATALSDPFTVVITQIEAQKYFGKTDVIGESITIENFSGEKHDFKVTGILDKYKGNSITNLSEDSPNNFFISDANLNFFGRTMDWQNPSIASYIELQPGVHPWELEKPIAQILKNHAPPKFQANMHPYLAPLKTYYLDQNNGLIRKMIYALSAIALFILAMAVINFINMSVSRSASRMKEIGIRKVLGGFKKQLMMQFLAESVITVFLATIAAFVIYGLAKNTFGHILGKEVPALTAFPIYYILYAVAFVLLLGFGAGLYPAFMLASLKSVESLKGRLISVKDKVLLRKGLIIFQFITATIAFAAAIIISKQVNFFLSKNLGYNKEYVLSAQVPRDWTQAGIDKMITIRDQFKTMPGIQDVSLSYEVPDGNNAGQSYIYRQGADTATALPMQFLSTDENFTNLYQIPLLAGSVFRGHRLDSGNVIMNETAIKSLGFDDADAALGQRIRFLGDPTVFTINGITSDFHFGSMQQKVMPIIMANVAFAGIYRYLSFKVRPDDFSASVHALQQKWSVLMNGAPFEYRFMDETLAMLYKSEIQLKRASYVASMLALIIVLLGVIGLVSLNIRRRTKEIGIRKVLGSSVMGILTLFIKEFLAVILIGGIVACPLAYLIMNSWLQEYAYRVQIGVMPFIISILCLGLITTLLICLQTIKAALTNPVKSLRTE